TGLKERGGKYLQRRKKLHGVNQVINLFSSIYVPGELQELGGFLHYSTQYNRTLYVKVGNATIYENRTSGEVRSHLNETRVKKNLTEAGLSYGFLSRRTVPLRVSLRDIQYLGGRRAIADSVSVVDVSGSMGGEPLEEAKNASKTFASIILNASNNRAGLVSYESAVDTVHRLTTDLASLNSTIESLSAGGNTCIGCGILEATDVVTEPSYAKIIPKKSMWKWNASYPDSTPPEKDGVKWYEPGYNAEWQENRTILGFGPEADTVLPDNGGDYFFRKKFEYNEPRFKGFKAFVRSSDAASVYINGHLVDNDTGEHDGKYWNRVLNGVNPFFTDGFERTGLGPDWTPTSGAEGDEVLVGDACGAAEGSNSMVLRWGGVTVESKSFNLSGEENITLSYSFKQGGGGGCEPPESGEDVNVQYLDSGGNWNTLKTHPGGGTDPSNGVWSGYSFELPQDALHSDFRLRFEYPSASGQDYDYWAVDDVNLGKNITVDDSVLKSGTNLVAVRLKNDDDAKEQHWVTDTDPEWNQGTFDNTTASGSDLKLEANLSGTREDVDASKYCQISGYTGYGEYITNVAVHGIDRSSGDNNGYLDATGSITDALEPGNTYTLSVTFHTNGYTEYATAAFDWDGDNQISDDPVYEVGSCSSNGCTVSTDITVPDDAVKGSHLMRVVGEYSSYHYDMCSDPNYNEVEDYSAFKVEETYPENGTYTSKTVDVGFPVDWNSSSVSAEVPPDTGYSLDFTNSTHWFDTLQDVPDSRYLGFNASLTTTNESVTPSLDFVNVSYTGNEVGFDLALNGTEERRKSMIVMSDGEANVETSMTDVPDHDGDGDVDAKDHTIEAACRANENHNVTVYAVGFGSGADNQTLNLTARCGDGEYYYSSTGELEEVFRNISQDIFRASFIGQTVELAGGESLGTLYSDSFLSLNYTSPAGEEGTFSLTQVSDRFGGNVSSPKNGSFSVPPGVDVLSAAVTSYSSNYWTDRLLLQNSSGWEHVYRLWRYGEDYRDLGDPFRVHIPASELSTGVNNVSLATGLNRTDRRGGSPDDRVIYT
ncbi:MAG: VWA domain-containing protein, partial [Candidatus Nanohaloarchaea archaeon]